MGRGYSRIGSRSDSPIRLSRAGILANQWPNSNIPWGFGNSKEGFPSISGKEDTNRRICGGFQPTLYFVHHFVNVKHSFPGPRCKSKRCPGASPWPAQHRKPVTMRLEHPLSQMP